MTLFVSQTSEVLSTLNYDRQISDQNQRLQTLSYQIFLFILKLKIQELRTIYLAFRKWITSVVSTSVPSKIYISRQISLKHITLEIQRGEKKQLHIFIAFLNWV